MSARPDLDWNDLRHFLAVAETGSTLAAGRRLHVSQTTAARRVAALEEALGLHLFDRRQAGYALTAAGEALLPRARVVEAAVLDLSDSAGATAREMSGEVRVSAARLLGTTVLPAILRDLHDTHPAIRIDLEITDDVVSLDAGGAEVAIRSCERPEGTGLVARRIADDPWAIYCSRSYAERHGRPMRRRELDGHAFVGGGEDGVWRIYGAWLRANGLEDAVAMRVDAAAGLLAAVRADAGLAVLPCVIADQDPELLQCLQRIYVGERSMWLLTHERVRHAPRVRLVLDFLAGRLKALAKVAEAA